MEVKSLTKTTKTMCRIYKERGIKGSVIVKEYGIETTEGVYKVIKTYYVESDIPYVEIQKYDTIAGEYELKKYQIDWSEYNAVLKELKKQEERKKLKRYHESLV